MNRIISTMAYDTVLAERMRPHLLPRAGVSEKAMFGGVAFLLYGNMCCGIWPASRGSDRKSGGRKDLLVIRLSKKEGAKVLKKPNTRVMDITGRPMRGWLLVEPAGYKNDKELFNWIDMAFAFASSLPRKQNIRRHPRPI